jgi:hypothetical protein
VSRLLSWSRSSAPKSLGSRPTSLMQAVSIGLGCGMGARGRSIAMTCSCSVNRPRALMTFKIPPLIVFNHKDYELKLPHPNQNGKAYNTPTPEGVLLI